MATLRDVRRWAVWNGVTHIVDSERSGWIHTLCDTMTSGEGMNEPPLKARICRKCRKRLADAVVIEPETKGA